MIPIPSDWETSNDDERGYFLSQHLLTYGAVRAVVGITHIYFLPA